MTQTHRFKIDKLIRDKLPEIMRASGIRVVEHILEKDDYVKRLKDKLLEEAKEVIESKSETEICEELADLLEVIRALLKVYAIDFEHINHTAQKKREEKGGFDNRIYTEFVDIEADNPSLNYYKKQPDKYPEIK